MAKIPWRRTFDQNGDEHVITDENAFPRSEQAVLGAGNFLDNKAVDGSSNNVSWVVNKDKSVTITANNSSADTFITLHSFAQNLIPEGHYYAKDFGEGIGETYMYVARKKGSSGTEVNFTTNNADHVAEFTVDYSEYDYYYVAILIKEGETFTKTLKPMFAISIDTPYAPYAMTNKQLTDIAVGLWSPLTTIDLSETALDGLGILTYTENPSIHLAILKWGGNGTAPNNQALSRFDISSYITENVKIDITTVLRNADQMYIRTDKTLDLSLKTSAWSGGMLMFPTVP